MTKQLLAKQIQIENGIIIPMIDARRMEVFTAFYDKNHNQIRNTQAEIIDETSYQEISETIHLVGDGISKFKEVLTENKFVFHEDELYPSANEMSALSYQKFANNIVEICTNKELWNTLHQNSEKGIYPFSIEAQKEEIFRMLEG